MFKLIFFPIALAACGMWVHGSQAVSGVSLINNKVDIAKLAPKDIDFSKIHFSAIPYLTEKQIKNLNLNQLKSITFEQIRQLTKIQMPFFSAAQLANLIPGPAVPVGTPKSPEKAFLSLLSVDQLSCINLVELKNMINNSNWLLVVKNLLWSDIQNIPVSIFTVAELEKAGFIPALNATQLATKLNATGKSLVESLSIAQLATANQAAIRQLPAPLAATVINSSDLLGTKQYTPAEIAQLALIISYFNKTKFQGLPGELIAQLPTAAFDPSQNSAPYNRTMAADDGRPQPSWLTDTQIKALSPAQITSLSHQINRDWPTPAQIPLFARCKELSGAFLEKARLSSAQLKAITPEQLSIMAQSITSGQIQMNLSYFAQTQQLTLGAEIKKANRYDEIRNGITVDPKALFDMLGW